MASFFEESVRSNPWKTEKKHPYDGVLDLFQRSQSHHMLSSQEIDEKCNESSLFCGIDVIKKVRETQQKITQARIRCVELNLENQASDVLRTEEMKSKLHLVEALLNGFEVSVKESQKLQSTLTETYKGENLKIENKFHENVKDLFINAVKMLNLLQFELDSLQWHKDNRFDDASLKNVLKTLSASVSELQKGMSVVENAKNLLTDK